MKETERVVLANVGGYEYTTTAKVGTPEYEEACEEARQALRDLNGND